MDDDIAIAHNVLSCYTKINPLIKIGQKGNIFIVDNHINKNPNWVSHRKNDDLVSNGPSKAKWVYDIILFAKAIINFITEVLHLCGVVDLQSLQERATDLFGIIL